MRKSLSDKAFNIINIASTLIITVIVVYPLYFVIIASFSDPYAVANGGITLLPKGFTLDAYKNVFSNSDIWIGYRNTIIYTIAGTLYNLILTIPAAYVLSKKYLPMRGVISWFFFITMYFSGGLIPTYMLYNKLNLVDTPYALILGVGVSCWNLIVTRQFFTMSIPDEIYQSARIDGASEIKIFIRIAVPLSIPILAVMALFYGVGHWNSYYNALIYLTDKKYFPLQLVLRNILVLNQTNITNLMESNESSTEALKDAARIAYMINSMKYALIFIASAPLLAAYPFVQKHFVKGMMIGSVKG